MRALSGLSPRLQDLYGLLQWHCREGKWCISLADLAEELGLKRKKTWVSRLLSRLRKLKLIDWRRRGPWKSEYWILSFPDPVWLQAQIRSCGPMRKTKTKDLTTKELAEKPTQELAERPTHLMLSPFVSNGAPGEEKVTNRRPFPSPTPPQFPAVRQHEHTNGRKNRLVPVHRNHVGRCAYCGARPINERYCVCDGAIAAYEQLRAPQAQTQIPKRKT